MARIVAVALLVLCWLPGACSSGSSDLAVGRSGERGEGTDRPGRTEGSPELCAELADVAADLAARDDEDPDAESARALADRLRELAREAPVDIAEALEVYAGVSDRVAELEEGDADGVEALGEALALFLDPRVLEAGAVLVEFAIEECALDPVEAEGLFGGDETFGGPGPEEPDAPDEGALGGRITLEDLDAVKEASAGEPWVDKIISTAIADGRQVTLSAAAAGEAAGEPLSPAEALAACDAVREALEDRQWELAVAVQNGEATVASGAAGVPCTTE